MHSQTSWWVGLCHYAEETRRQDGVGKLSEDPNSPTGRTGELFPCLAYDSSVDSKLEMQRPSGDPVRWLIRKSNLKTPRDGWVD